ncbi:hypothetical protein DFP73DRAFT_522160 [Morchella snyderi]|nr:hypothetical protein DFP73DRAFT_522160 [Morchella snyderi]
MPSPSYQPDSPTNSIPSRDGGQHTPTYPRDSDISENHISEWDTEDVGTYIASIGLDQYRECFIEEGIDGEALIHLEHDELRDIGIKSVGHRLTILKNIYHLKVAHGVTIEPEHYVPVSADADENEKAATQNDIQRLITIIRRRDERIVQAERDLQKMQDAFVKLREELLPVWRIIKNSHKEAREKEQRERERESLSRKFSMKKLILGTPKNASPTHPTHPDTVRNEYEPPPTATNGAIRDIRDSSAMPSPTSPSTINHLSPNTTHTSSSHKPPERRSAKTSTDEEPPNTAGGSQPTVEIFKSFRVSMDDPCYKVLPAALKRYNIQADWRQYALYIVHGDQERCLGLDEKPLILFKQLDKEGRKPMFMLRRNGNFETSIGPGTGLPGGSGSSIYGRGQDITLPGVLPGGVL